MYIYTYYVWGGLRAHHNIKSVQPNHNTHKMTAAASTTPPREASFVADKSQLYVFLKRFLPYDPYEALVISLFARRKHFPALSKNSLFLGREIFTGGTNIDDAVRRIECMQYKTHFDNGNPIPRSAYAMYFSPTFRDVVSAFGSTTSRLLDILNSRSDHTDPMAMFQLELCKAQVRMHYIWVGVDLDTLDPERVKEAFTMLKAANVAVQYIVSTLNGYHILYRKQIGDTIDHEMIRQFKRSTVFQKRNVHGQLVTDHWFSTNTDPLIAVPGTRQGEYHVVSIIHPEE